MAERIDTTKFVRWPVSFNEIAQTSPVGNMMLASARDDPSTALFEYPAHKGKLYEGIVWKNPDPTSRYTICAYPDQYLDAAEAAADAAEAAAKAAEAAAKAARAKCTKAYEEFNAEWAFSQLINRDIDSSDERAPIVWIPMESAMELIGTNQLKAGLTRTLINTNKTLARRFIQNQMAMNRLGDAGGVRIDRDSTGNAWGGIPSLY